MKYTKWNLNEKNFVTSKQQSYTIRPQADFEQFVYEPAIDWRARHTLRLLDSAIYVNMTTQRTGNSVLEPYVCETRTYTFNALLDNNKPIFS